MYIIKFILTVYILKAVFKHLTCMIKLLSSEPTFSKITKQEKAVMVQNRVNDIIKKLEEERDLR